MSYDTLISSVNLLNDQVFWTDGMQKVEQKLKLIWNSLLSKVINKPW